ncbi:MAG: hypothetical protein JWO11_4118 [Nocardioides sp.]|nr:hypothetical protein [Nocardioides sp.]
MTAQTVAVTATQRLEDLAALWLNDQWATHHETELHTLAGDRPEHHTWSAFEDLAEAVRLRNGLNDGPAHWSEVDDSLTGWDRSTAAWDIACGRVDDAAHTLLNGRH